MLFTLIYIQRVFSFSGVLTPEGNKDVKLAETRTNQLGWISSSDMGDSRESDLVEYDWDKKSLKVNGKPICVVKDKTVKFCDNTYVFTKWELYAEDGFYKIKTDDGSCLSVGQKASSFAPTIIAKCKSSVYQRFQYAKNSDDAGRIETIKNDYDEGASVILNMALKAYDNSTPVEVIIHDSKDGNKRINTSIGELNTLYAFNHNNEKINHDMLVDTSKKNHQTEDR